jgi:hypothetical protein
MDESQRNLNPPPPAPPAPPAPAVEPSRPFNVLDAIVGTFVRPAATMREIAAARPWLWAAVIIGVLGFLSGLSQLTGLPGLQASLDEVLAQVPGSLRQEIETFLNPAFFGGFIVALSFASLFLAPLFSVILHGLTYLIARALGGEGKFSGLYATQGFASLPTLPAIPVLMVANLLGPLGQLISLPVSFAIFIWNLVLSVLGIREAMNLSTGRAIGTVAIMLLLGFLLICCVFVITFALVFTVFSAAVGR